MTSLPTATLTLCSKKKHDVRGFCRSLRTFLSLFTYLRLPIPLARDLRLELVVALSVAGESLREIVGARHSDLEWASVASKRQKL